MKTLTHSVHGLHLIYVKHAINYCLNLSEIEAVEAARKHLLMSKKWKKPLTTDGACTIMSVAEKTARRVFFIIAKKHAAAKGPSILFRRIMPYVHIHGKQGQHRAQVVHP